MIDNPADLSAYLDGELSAPDAIRIEAHLAGCGDCRSELEDLRQARAAVRGLPLLVPPEDVFETPAPVPANVTPLRSWTSRTWLPVAAVLALVVVWAGLRTPTASIQIPLGTATVQHATSSASQPGVILATVPLEGIDR